MNRLMLLAAGAAVLGLAACDRPARVEAKTGNDNVDGLRTVSKLDCPEKQGELTRVSAAQDGLSCVYQSQNAEVTLRLVALTNGDARAALAPIETELKGIIPPPARSAGATASVSADSSGQGGGSADIDFPGLQIKADDGGARIRIGGIRIDADDGGAQVKVGDETVINATDAGAEIRQNESEGDGIQQTYILASEEARNGYNVVGYEARGPKAGPLVVAVVRARESRSQHDLFDDMKDLVEHNVGD